MVGIVLIAVFGGAVALGTFFSGLGVYVDATTSIHQTYAAILMLMSMLGLLTMTVAISAAVVASSVRQASREAASDNRKVADKLEALVFVAERRRVA